MIPKGSFAELRHRNSDEWTEELIGRLPGYLAAHLRIHRQAVADATLLNVVCGRLTEWIAPGLLLIGDAAHPMSPVGGQGVSIALRDALMAANHLCPVLTAGDDPAAIDAAARKVQDERVPEVATIQKIQDEQSRALNNPDQLRSRIAYRILPFLFRTGLLQWLQRREPKLLSEGVVSVQLTAK
jgi:2-polyprenyl-6-methoxyphenol hydroxylase-like FAD-dependent oxidoreductase